MPPIFNAVGRPAVTQLSGDAADFVNSQVGFEEAFFNPEREAQQAQAYAQVEQQQQEIALRGQMEREKRARQEAHYQEIGAFNANQRGVAPGGGAAQPIDPRALGDQRDLLKAGREIAAITRAGQNGWSEAQVASARESLVKQYGVAGVMNAPGGAQFLGREQEWQQQKQEGMQQYAAKHGIDERLVRWNEETSSPDFDGHAAQIEGFKAGLQKEKINSLAAGVAVVNEQATSLANFINTQTKLGNTGPVVQRAMQRLGEMQLEQFRGYKPIREAMGLPTHDGKAGSAVPPVPSDGVSTELVEAINNTPAPPVAESVSYTKFASRTEAETAAKTGQIPVGKTIIVEGKRLILKSNGTFGRAN